MKSRPDCLRRQCVELPIAGLESDPVASALRQLMETMTGWAERLRIWPPHATMQTAIPMTSEYLPRQPIGRISRSQFREEGNDGGIDTDRRAEVENVRFGVVETEDRDDLAPRRTGLRCRELRLDLCGARAESASVTRGLPPPRKLAERVDRIGGAC